MRCFLDFDKAESRRMFMEHPERIWRTCKEKTMVSWRTKTDFKFDDHNIIQTQPSHQPFLFAGYPVCRDAWAHMVGIGKHRLSRCRHTWQGKDGRSMTGPGGNLSLVKHCAQLCPQSLSLKHGPPSPYQEKQQLDCQWCTIIWTSLFVVFNGRCWEPWPHQTPLRLLRIGATCGQVSERDKLSDPSLLERCRANGHYASCCAWGVAVKMTSTIIAFK